jgi:hypothetical protein
VTALLCRPFNKTSLPKQRYCVALLGDRGNK